MKNEAFEALLTRRDELLRQHTQACEVLEEEGPSLAQHNYPKCARLFDEAKALQEQIDAELEAERSADSASCNNP